MSETEAVYNVPDEYWQRVGVSMQRCLRLMDIIERLQDRRYTTRELAERYTVSRRTIRADLQLIQGHPRYAPLVSERAWGFMTVGEDDS